jgi:MFS family permease
VRTHRSYHRAFTHPRGLRESALPKFVVLGRRTSFWLLAIVLALLLFAASAPSPLYRVYQAAWQFSPLTLTAIYGSYALGGLAALLTTGRLSDHLGRRLVLSIGLAINAFAMLLFLVAGDIVVLFAARILTGIGVGIAAGAVSAWLLDLSPPDDPQMGSVVNGAGPLLGLGGGALISGVLVEFAPDPLHLVYWLLAAAYGIAIVILIAIPNPVIRRPGWRATLRPSVGVPSTARTTFVAATPAVVGMWSLGGLYLALGPSLAVDILNSDSRLAGGLIIFTLAGTGAGVSFLLRRADPYRLLVTGSAVMIAGVAVTLLGVLGGSVAILYAGSFLAGIGLGAGFSGFVRATAPLAPPERRGALVAAIYVVIYVSFSVPTIIAGAAVTVYGLRATAYGYGIVVIALAAATTVAVSRRLRRMVATA